MSRILSSLSWRRVRRLQVVEGSFVFLSLLSSGQWQDARKRRSVQHSMIYPSVHQRWDVTDRWIKTRSIGWDAWKQRKEMKKSCFQAYCLNFKIVKEILSINQEMGRQAVGDTNRLSNLPSLANGFLRMPLPSCRLKPCASSRTIIGQWIPSSFWSQRQEVTIRKMKMY